MAAMPNPPACPSGPHLTPAACIVLCPCCASAQDATPGTTPGAAPQFFTCVACGQRWSMTVDADRFAEHALH